MRGRGIVFGMMGGQLGGSCDWEYREAFYSRQRPSPWLSTADPDEKRWSMVLRPLLPRPLLREGLRLIPFVGRNVWEGKIIGYALWDSRYLIRWRPLS